MAWQLNFSAEYEWPHIEFIDTPKGMPLFGLSFNVPVDRSKMPTRARIAEPWSQPLPDIFMTPGVNGVSQKFRDLVESFEPGVHQFFPLKIFNSDDSPLEGQHYIFNCAVGVDAILLPNKEKNWGLDAVGTPIAWTGMGEKFEISRPAIGKRHLWCGQRIAENDLFASDEFYRAVEVAEVKAFRSVYRAEVGKAWVPEENLRPLLEWEARRH